jgi:hypothetical protein
VTRDQRATQIDSMLQRAEKLLDELYVIYKRDLEIKDISLEAINITHEIIEKCSNVLDQCMAAVFDLDIKPHLTVLPKRGGYFPAAADEASYRSTMGQWGAPDLQDIAPGLDTRLRALQPFFHPDNKVFGRIRELANKKHTRLVPQQRLEQRRTHVTRPGYGAVSWGPGVTFGQGVSVVGVPIDPVTQMPAHNIGIEVTVERWISFHLEEGGEDALAFCRASIAAARRALKSLL